MVKEHYRKPGEEYEELICSSFWNFKSQSRAKIRANSPHNTIILNKSPKRNGHHFKPNYLSIQQKMIVYLEQQLKIMIYSMKFNSKVTAILTLETYRYIQGESCVSFLN